MTLITSPEGTVLSLEPLRNREIEQRIQEAMEVIVAMFEFPILGHPAMHPELGFVEMVCFFPISFLS
jgi:hypothetical protein